MQALILAEVGRFEVVQLPEPEPGPSEVLIRVHQSGICGSELGGFRGTDGLRKPGLAFGHEFVGVVETYGSDVGDDQRLPLGSVVTANPLRSCQNCTVCRSGHTNVCPHRQLLGGHIHGSNAELVCVPATALHRLDDLDHPETGILAEPTACALRAVRQTRIGAGASALVLGAGPIGLLILEVLRHLGAGPIFFTEQLPARIAAAASTGAVHLADDPDTLITQLHDHSDGLGVEVVFDAVGSAGTRLTATRAVRPGGVVCLVGLHAGDSVLPVRDLIRREITCTTSFAYSAEDFADAVRLLGSGQLRFPGDIVSASLADGQDWYVRLSGGDPAGKVLLDPRP